MLSVHVRESYAKATRTKLAGLHLEQMLIISLSRRGFGHPMLLLEVSGACRILRWLLAQLSCLHQTSMATYWPKSLSETIELNDSLASSRL